MAFRKSSSSVHKNRVTREVIFFFFTFRAVHQLVHIRGNNAFQNLYAIRFAASGVCSLSSLAA